MSGPCFRPWEKVRVEPTQSARLRTPPRAHLGYWCYWTPRSGGYGTLTREGASLSRRRRAGQAPTRAEGVRRHSWVTLSVAQEGGYSAYFYSTNGGSER